MGWGEMDGDGMGMEMARGKGLNGARRAGEQSLYRYRYGDRCPARYRCR